MQDDNGSDGGPVKPAEHERHCSLCEGQYIHDECDGLGLGPPDHAEHEQAAQDAEQPYPQDTGDWRFGPCVRCGDDPITWPQSDTTPIKCLTCQSYERGLAEGARAERERIEKLLRHYGSVVDLEK